MSRDGAMGAATANPVLLPCAQPRRRRASSTRTSGTDMGKGDKKTRKGKIYRGSHGNVRPHSPISKSAVKKTSATKAAKPVARAPAKKAPAKKAPAKKAPAKKAAPAKPA
jgi:ribosomal small subunit protein bTHX